MERKLEVVALARSRGVDKSPSGSRSKKVPYQVKVKIGRLTGRCCCWRVLVTSSGGQRTETETETDFLKAEGRISSGFNEDSFANFEGSNSRDSATEIKLFMRRL